MRRDIMKTQIEKKKYDGGRERQRRRKELTGFGFRFHHVHSVHPSLKEG